MKRKANVAMNKVLIIIPAYNEEANIQSVVQILIKDYPQFDYIVVNDGSKDHTVDICKENGFNLLNLSVNCGLAGAFQAGMKYAERMGYELAIQYDGDGQHNPAYIANMVHIFETQDINIVIGSRFQSKKKPKSLRMLGNSMIEAAIKLTTRTKLTDPTSGMRMFDSKMIRILSQHPDLGPEPDTMAYMLKCGAKIEEIQVEMCERTAGESYLNFTRSMEYMLRMCMSILFIQWFRKKDIL